MQVNVIVFGQISDITGRSSITVNDVADTGELVQKLYSQYPALRDAKYAMAVNKKVVKENISLTDGNTVALLPPFSGG